MAHLDIDLMHYQMEYGMYKDKGLSEGLDRSDYNELNKLYTKLVKLSPEDELSVKIIRELYTIRKMYTKSGMFTGFHMDEDYILKNASIIPLLMAHTDGTYEIRDGRVYFNSIFAKDINHSMYVSLENNEVRCKKSKIKLHNFPLLMKLEKDLSCKKEAMFLLCYIFNYKIPTKKEDIMLLADKYRRIILSSEYKELIDELYDHSNPEYQKRINDIIRIDNGIYDGEFTCSNIPNKLYLKQDIFF